MISRLLRNKKFWIGIGIFIVVILCIRWLVGSYKPPFPPRWVGIKYYLFDSDSPIAHDDVDEAAAGLGAIQSALVIFKPATPEAHELLPKEITLNTFTLTDEDAMDAILTSTLAKYLTGIDPAKQTAAQKILENPEEAVMLDKLLVAVTQSNNIASQDQLINEKLNTYGWEITPKKYDDVQKKVILAPTVDPLSEKKPTESSMSPFVVKKTSMYRVHKKEESSQENGNDFTRVNNVLVPLVGGNSALVIFEPGTYSLEKNMSASPITYHLGIHTIEGMPYNFKSIGHGWASLSWKNEDMLYPIMTMSLFNSLDTDNKQNLELGDLSNIATYTNLWINHPHDWERTIKILNKVPLTEGPTRTQLSELTLEQVRSILLMREWYMPKYSTQEYYMDYLRESLGKSRSLKDALAVIVEITHVYTQNIMNLTFWKGVQAWMNGTNGDTRYNGITSNCVAYTTDFWNSHTRLDKYNPRVFGIVPAPGQLFQLMNTEDVIDLPDATK